MSYVISGIGVSAEASAIVAGMQPAFPASAYAAPPAKVVQSAKPGPDAIYYPVPVVQSAKPGPNAIYLPVPKAAPIAPVYAAPTAAPAAAFDWKPWAIGVVVLGGGLYLLFR